MKRILHCLPGNLDVGGIENFIINVNKNIDLDKYTFDYIVHKKENNFYEPEVKKMNGIIHRLPNKSQSFFDYRRQFKEVIKKYEIIHIHSVYAFSVFEVMWARKEGLKVILHSHNSSASKKRKVLHYCFKSLQDRYIDVRLTCSDKAKKWMFNKKNYDEVILIDNAFDTKKYLFNNELRNNYRRVFNIEEKCIVLGNTSRFSRQKNPIFAIEVFNRLYQKNPNYRLFLIGEGDLKKDIEKRIELYKLQSVVHIVPSVKNVNEILNFLDIFIFPSLYEGLGISLVEAQINGLQCIVNENIPKEAIILPNKVQKESIENIQNWTKAVEKLENDSFLNRKVNLEVFGDFDIENIISKLESIYK